MFLGIVRKISEHLFLRKPTKVVNYIYKKRFITDIWEGPKYVSDEPSIFTFNFEHIFAGSGMPVDIPLGKPYVKGEST